VCLLNTDIDTETPMSSPSADHGVADGQQAIVPNLVEELSQLNTLLRIIVADKGRQDPPPTKTESLVDQPENVIILAEKLRPDPKRIYFNYQELMTFVELLLPTEQIFQQLYKLFLGVFSIDGIGEQQPPWRDWVFPIGESTLQIHVEDNKLVSIPWTQVPRIEGLARRRDVTQEVKSLIPTLNNAWPREIPQRHVVDFFDHKEFVIDWQLEQPGCNLSRTGLIFNLSGYLQTMKASCLVILGVLG
jgi:hypothetical protein